MKTEVKVEVKEEPLNDLYVVHDNSNQNAKLTKGEKNLKLKEESYFDEVHEEMGIDFVTSKTFDEEYLKTTKSQDGEKSPQSSDNSNSQDISAGETSKTNQHPETLEELLERQWDQGSQFLREGGRHFDSKFYHLTYYFLDNRLRLSYVFKYPFQRRPSQCQICNFIIQIVKRLCQNRARNCWNVFLFALI